MRYLIEIHHGIGDVVQMTGVIESICSHDEYHHIDLIINKKAYSNLFENDSRVENFYYIDFAEKKNKYKRIFDEITRLRKTKYDYYLVSGHSNKKYSNILAMLVRAELKTGEQFKTISKICSKYRYVNTKSIHMVERNYDLVKTAIKDSQFMFPSLVGQDMSDKCGVERKIALVVGTKAIQKNWPIRNYLDVGKYFKEKGYEVLLLGGEVEKKNYDKYVEKDYGFVNLLGMTTLSEVTGYAKLCDLVIGGDTAIMHISAAVGVPTLTLFGSSNPRVFSAYSNQSFIYESPEPLYCKYCFDRVEISDCQDVTCMNNIKQEEVIRISEDILAHRYGNIEHYKLRTRNRNI